MKKFIAWLMVLSVGMFVMGCGEGEKKKDTPKPDAKKTTPDEGEKK